MRSKEIGLCAIFVFANACQQEIPTNEKIREEKNPHDTWIEKNRRVDNSGQIDFTFKSYNWTGEKLDKLNFIVSLRNRSNTPIILTEAASPPGEMIFGVGEHFLVEIEGIWWRSLTAENDFALMVREVGPGESVEILLESAFPGGLLTRADEIKIEYCGFLSESFKVLKE